MEPLPRAETSDPEEAILRYLIELPGVFVPHSGTTFFHHLLGTYRVLKEWHCEEDVCLAGLFHAVYGTPAFDHPSLITEEHGLRDVIGGKADSLVRAFSRTDWAHALQQGSVALDSLPPELLTLAAANFVEQHGRLAHVGLPEEAVAASAERFALLAPYLAPKAAQGLISSLLLVPPGERQR